MEPKIETPAEIDMLLYVNKYLRSTHQPTLEVICYGDKLVTSHIEEIVYLEYMEFLSNLWIKARAWSIANNDILDD